MKKQIFLILTILLLGGIIALLLFNNPQTTNLNNIFNKQNYLNYLSPASTIATSGSSSTDGNYTVVTFSESGTFNVSGDALNVTILIVAGGGAGGGYAGGGGGAGGLIYEVGYSIPSGNYNVVVGQGGAGVSGNNHGNNGTNSSFNNLSAVGGGGGAYYNAGFANGYNGGSGGGASRLGTAGIGTAGQGYNGGIGNDDGPNYPGGGGGGAGSVGGNATTTLRGEGGSGVAYSITGSSVTYAVGGSGATYLNSTAPPDATDGTGNGGTGGGTAGTASGDGGNGIVIIRYLTLAQTPSGLSVTLNSPDNEEFIETNTVNFNVTVTDDLKVENVTLYINEILNETNSTNYNGTYIFNKYLSDGSYNWSILAFDNDSNLVQSATRTFTIDTSTGWENYLKEGILVHYDFEETTGTNVKDEVNNRNGTIYGTLELDVPGVVGNAFNFSGGGCINMTGLTSSSGIYTISMWLNAHNLSVGQTGFDTQSGRLFQYLTEDATAHLGYYDGAVKNFGSDLNTTNFNHYVMTFNSTGGMLFINGVKSGSTLTYTSKNIGGAVTLGCNYIFSARYLGLMDSFTLYNRTLNQSEITEIYSNGINQIPFNSPPIPSGLNYTSQSDNDTATYPTNNDSVLHTALFNSNVTLGSYVFSTNASGSWVNDTAVEMSGTSAWANVTKFLHYPKNTIVSWLMYVNNSETSISTSILTYIIKNSLPLIVGEPTLNDTSVFQNEHILISVNVTDEDGLSDINSVIAGINAGSDTVGTLNLSKIDYDKYPTNPINMTHDRICSYPTGDAENGEISFWYKDGVIHSIYRICQAEESNILYANSTDGTNFTHGVNLTLDGNTAGFYSYTLPQVVEYNGSYYMTAGLQPGDLDQYLFKANSTDPKSWTKACSGASQILSGTYYNAEILWETINNSGGTELGMYISTGGGGAFNIKYYNTTDLTGCSGWTDQGTILSNAESTWSTYRNNKWIVYYAEKWNNATGMWVVSVAQGDTPNTITPTRRGVIIGDQTWENPGSNSMMTVPDIAIIPEENWADFDYKFYGYYDGNQNETGMFFDSQNRYFDEAHFNIIQGNSSNVTLSQEGGSSIWSGAFTNTTEAKTYNITSVWINDGDDVNYSTYSNISFDVAEFTNPDISINITYPDSPHEQTNNTINFISNIAIVPGTNPTTLSNVSLYINGTINQTNSSGLEGVYNFEVEFADGYYSWYIVGINNESTSKQSDIKYFTIDTTAPTVSITYPTGTENYFKVGNNETLNYSISGDYDSCWYEYNGTNNTLDCSENSIEFEYILNENEITVYANDSLGNLDLNISTWEYRVIETARSFSETSLTTILENFYLNFTTNEEVIPVVYIEYNGIEYLSTDTGTTTEHQILSQVSINETGINQFRWKITYDEYIIYTEYSNQTVENVSSISFVEGACSAGLTQVLNFTFAHEKNLTALDGITIKFNFQYGITNSTGQTAFGILSNVAQASLCLNTTETTNYTVGYGEVQYEKTGYALRRYYIFENTRLSNETINTTLYMLENDDSTSFLIEIRSPTLEPYSGIYTTLLRWYPDENEYKIVEMGKTDDKGQTVKKIKIEDVDYRIGVYETNGSLIHLINPIRMVCLATPCSYTINIPTTSSNQFSEVSGIEAEITWNNGTFTLTYNDPSQNTELMSLRVYRMGGTEHRLLCEANGTAFTGILTCDVSGESGTLKAIAVRTASPERTIASLIIDTLTTVFTGTFGLFLQFLIVVLLAFMGIISPVVAIIMGVLALIVGVLLFKTMTYPIFIGIAILGGIIIHLMRRQTS